METAAAHAEGAHTALPTLRPQPDGATLAHARNGAFHHRVYLAEVTNKGDFKATDAEMTAAVDQVLHRWVGEADGAIASFHRIGSVHPFTTSTNCQDGTAMWPEAKAAWPDVDFHAPGNHLVVLAPPGCDFGIGTIGRSLASGGEVEVRYDPHYFAQDLMHELGHNFSLRHADAQVCDPKCRLSSYNDHYSFMGASMYGGFEPPALESIVRSQLGIAQQCELPAVQLAAGQQQLSAVYDLFARSTDTGTRGLRVRDPSTGTRYWVEWRNHAGRDAQTSYGPNARSSVAGRAATYDTGIVIDERAADGDTYVLSYPDGAGLAFAQQAGQHYTTPDGALTVQVDTIGAVTARVRVTLTDSAVTSAPALARATRHRHRSRSGAGRLHRHRRAEGLDAGFLLPVPLVRRGHADPGCARQHVHRAGLAARRLAQRAGRRPAAGLRAAARPVRTAPDLSARQALIVTVVPTGAHPNSHAIVAPGTWMQPCEPCVRYFALP